MNRRTSLAFAAAVAAAVAPFACAHPETAPAAPVEIAVLPPQPAAPDALSEAAAMVVEPTDAAPEASVAQAETDDAEDAGAVLGVLWGDQIGDAFGAGGLGLRGTASDGGGIGLGGIGSGRRDGGARLPMGAVRQGAVSVSGRLPPEIVQRIVRQNVGRVRLCYENALRRTPKLAGNVVVRFVIGANGDVSSASDGGSDLKDSPAVACVVASMRALSFPKPEAGVVVVSFTWKLSPTR